jgi:hypothetical protein
LLLFSKGSTLLGSFLKKRTKKLLSLGVILVCPIAAKLDPVDRDQTS